MGSLSEDDGSEVEAGFGATQACAPETAAAFEATQPVVTKSWWLRPLGDVAALGARPIRIPDDGAIIFGSRRADKRPHVSQEKRGLHDGVVSLSGPYREDLWDPNRLLSSASWAILRSLDRS